MKVNVLELDWWNEETQTTLLRTMSTCSNHYKLRNIVTKKSDWEKSFTLKKKKKDFSGHNLCTPGRLHLVLRPERKVCLKPREGLLVP